MQWYKHKSSEMFSIEVRKMIKKYGLMGYGFYMAVMECIARELTLTDVLPDLKENSETLADYFNEKEVKIAEMMQFCIEENIFQESAVDKRILNIKMYDLLDDSIRKSEKIKLIISEMKKGIDAHVIVKQIPGSFKKEVVIPENPEKSGSFQKNPAESVDKIRKESDKESELEKDQDEESDQHKDTNSDIKQDKELDKQKYNKSNTDSLSFLKSYIINNNHTHKYNIEFITALIDYFNKFKGITNIDYRHNFKSPNSSNADLPTIQQYIDLYSPDEIIKAIDNYVYILKNEEYYNIGTHYGSFISFLQKGIGRFLNGHKQFLKDKNKKPMPKIQEIKYKYFCEDCGDELQKNLLCKKCNAYSNNPRKEQIS